MKRRLSDPEPNCSWEHISCPYVANFPLNQLFRWSGPNRPNGLQSIIDLVRLT
jgi:hypothetical protein